MEAGDLLDSVKFSDGVKKPSGQDHAAAEGNYVIKASCRKKEAYTEKGITSGNSIGFVKVRKLYQHDRCKHQNTAGELASGESLMKENPTGKNRKNGFQAHKQRSCGRI